MQEEIDRGRREDAPTDEQLARGRRAREREEVAGDELRAEVLTDAQQAVDLEAAADGLRAERELRLDGAADGRREVHDVEAATKVNRRQRGEATARQRARRAERQRDTELHGEVDGRVAPRGENARAQTDDGRADTEGLRLREPEPREVLARLEHGERRLQLNVEPLENADADEQVRLHAMADDLVDGAVARRVGRREEQRVAFVMSRERDAEAARVERGGVTTNDWTRTGHEHQAICSRRGQRRLRQRDRRSRDTNCQQPTNDSHVPPTSGIQFFPEAARIVGSPQQLANV